MPKKTLLIVGEYKVNTGFSQVVTNLAQQFQKTFYVSILDHYKTGRYVDGLVTVFGKTTEADTQARQTFLNIFKSFDKILFINDIWNIDHYLELIRSHCFHDRISLFALPELFVYFPVDAEGHNPLWYRNFDLLRMGVTYTKFAKDVISVACPDFGPLMHILPHGYDPAIFHKIDMPKKHLRRLFFGHQQYDNSFIFLNANRNQPRKKHDITIRAFRQFLDITKATDAKLYLHCAVIDQNIDILAYCEQQGVSQHLIISDTSNIPGSMPKETFNLVYNICDVGVNSSVGEGWGLPATEHASLGKPQINPAHSACLELFKATDNPLVKADMPDVIPASLTTGRLPDVTSMANAMAKLYLSKEYYRLCAMANKAIFADPKYHWSTIAQRWVDEVLGE